MQTERNAKEKTFFLFISEVLPTFNRRLKVRLSERKTKSNLSFSKREYFRPKVKGSANPDEILKCRDAACRVIGGVTQNPATRHAAFEHQQTFFERSNWKSELPPVSSSMQPLRKQEADEENGDGAEDDGEVFVDAAVA